VRKIFLRLLLVLGIAGLAVGATGAYFSDTILAADNTITAGTLSMTVNGSTNPNAVFTANNMSPGGASGWATAVGAGGVTIKNTGSITGDAWLDIQNINVTGGVGGDTSLADRIQPVIELNQPPYGTVYASGQSMNALNGVDVNIGNLAPGQSISIFIYDLWPDAGVTLDNQAQGETLNYTVAFHLDQLH
jgi:hypothetical protein